MQAQQIRQHYRQIRRQLTAQKQQLYALLLSENIKKLLGFSHDKKIAAYLATQSEISLNPWIVSSQRQRIYLPMLYESIQPRLRFAPLDAGTRWKQNRFNITEPDTHWGQTLHARQLDMVLLPLVAFDRQGNRMGMGGGFYDRSLAFRNLRHSWKRPQLVGVAYSCQEHSGLPSQHWDVPLDTIITEKEIIIPA